MESDAIDKRLISRVNEALDNESLVNGLGAAAEEVIRYSHPDFVAYFFRPFPDEADKTEMVLRTNSNLNDPDLSAFLEDIKPNIIEAEDYHKRFLLNRLNKYNIFHHLLFSRNKPAGILIVGCIDREISNNEENLYSWLADQSDKSIFELHKTLELMYMQTDPTTAKVVALDPEKRRRIEEMTDEMICHIYSDICGFSRKTRELELTPKEVQELLNNFLISMAEITKEYSGFIDKYMGDCILSLVGPPLFPSEKEPDNGAKTYSTLGMSMVLKMRETTRCMSWKDGTPLDVSIGVNTGVSAFGKLGRNPGDITAVGDEMNLAQRLQDAAGYGQILVSDRTYSFVKDDFIFDNPLIVSVKNMGEVEAYPLLGYNY